MGRTLRIEHARAYLPLLRPARYKGLYGGRGSAKSHEFAKLAIQRCMSQRGTRIVCVREVQKDLEQSVKRVIEDKLEEYQLGWNDGFRVLETHIETPGDGIIIFKGMQSYNAEGIKSLEGFDVAWVEEAQTISERSLTLLRPTMFRKEGSEIWLSWNPRKKTDPVDVLLRGANVPPGAVVIGTTYEDNPWFPEGLRLEMEWDRQTDPDKYNHVWLGAYEQHSEATVFKEGKNWRVEEFVTPANAHFLTGADWGFSIDPATLVRSFESLVDVTTGQAWPRKRLYIDRDLYRIGVEIDYLPSFFDGLVCGCPLVERQQTIPGELLIPETCRDRPNHGAMRAWPVIADSARPETISYMRRHGYGRMESAKKGPNSVKEGVMFLQGYEIIIHPRCKHAIDEFRAYCYKTEEVIDPTTGLLTERALPVFEDKKNHIIDPVRYAVEQLRGVLKVHKAVWG